MKNMKNQNELPVDLIGEVWTIKLDCFYEVHVNTEFGRVVTQIYAEKGDANITDSDREKIDEIISKIS